MTEKELPLSAREQRFLDYFRQAPEYEKPLIERSITRINMGVPVLKSMMLFRRDLALARAKAHHNGRA